MAWLFRVLFKAFGWKMIHNLPPELKKAAFCVAPHNTWKDFTIGLGGRAVIEKDLGVKIGFLGKAELFKPPFGFIFYALGGKPVDRFNKSNMVESQVKAIRASEDMFFAMAPEGTRKNVQKLRTGFYYMAYGAGIPIIPVGFDLPKKTIIMAEPFIPTGDFKKDMLEHFVPFFKTIGGFQKDWVKNYEEGKF